MFHSLLSLKDNSKSSFVFKKVSVKKLKPQWLFFYIHELFGEAFLKTS